MAFTISTIPMLLLIVVLYFAAEKQLGPVLMFMTIFQGAALVIIGGGASGLALAPAQIVLVLWILEKLVAKPIGGVKRPQAQLNVFTCLLLYGSYAVLSAIFCPFFFDGIPVSNPRSGLGSPLTWGMYNVTQGTYLILGIVVFWLCVFRSTMAEIKRSMDWFLIGCTVSALIAMYQYVSFNTGLPFPSELLHSNTQYTIFEAYDLGGFTRVNSTFTEAAAAAGCYSTALALVLWRVLFVEFTKPLLISLVTLLTALILTRSSSGYVALCFITMVTAGLYLKKTKVTHSVRVFRDAFALTIVVGAVVLAMIPDVREGVSALLDKVLFTKTQSASYEERTAWNNAAFAAGEATHWLGAGWGSLRASSLLANIMGTVGIPGLSLFAIFCLLDARLAIRIPADTFQTQKSVLLPIAVYLVDCLLAGPEMTDPGIWFLFGVAAFVSPTPAPSVGKPAFGGRTVRHIPFVPAPVRPVAAGMSSVDLPHGGVA